jgi:hypothetical protein
MSRRASQSRISATFAAFAVSKIGTSEQTSMRLGRTLIHENGYRLSAIGYRLFSR